MTHLSTQSHKITYVLCYMKFIHGVPQLIGVKNSVLQITKVKSL